MAHVILPRPLADLTGGELEFDVEAGNVRALIRELDQRCPGLGDLLSGPISVAIDGEIMSDPLLEPLEAESEVHFLPRVGGGSPDLEDR